MDILQSLLTLGMLGLSAYLAGFLTSLWLRSRRKRPEWAPGACFEATCRAETERYLYCPEHRATRTSPPPSPPSSEATATTEATSPWSDAGQRS